MHSGAVNAKEILAEVNPTLPERLMGHDLATSLPALDQYHDRYYGVILQLPLLAVDKFSHDTMSARQNRHLATYFLFCLGAIFLFGTVRELFGSRWLACLSVAMLFLSPRFFAEAFYNIKDIGELSTLLVAGYFLVRFAKEPRGRSAVLVGITSALAAAVRLSGALTEVIAVVSLGVFVLTKRTSWTQGLKLLGMTAIPFLVALVAFYPASWHNPLGFFPEAVTYMSKHPWAGRVVFMGQSYSGNELPWYYLPVWITITTPIPILVLFAVGTVFGAAQRKFPVLLSCGALAAFLILVAVGHPTIYNGWRQFYFLYLPILVTVAFGIQGLWSLVNGVHTSRAWVAKTAVSAVLLVSLVPEIVFMVQAHPYQNVYYNVLISDADYQDFEFDYWGLSQRQAVKKLVTLEAGCPIKISVEDGHTMNAWSMLPDQDKPKMQFVPAEEANYFIVNPPTPEEPAGTCGIRGQKVASVYVCGRTACDIYKK